MQNLSKFLNIKRIYFIGIGGISLSALSFIMKKEGFVVAGSDEKQSEITTKLNKSGIKVFIKHKQKNIKNFKPDLVVFSGAIHHDNKELIFAKKMGITCLERPDFIKLILKTAKRGPFTANQRSSRLSLLHDMLNLGLALRDIWNQNFNL